MSVHEGSIALAFGALGGDSGSLEEEGRLGEESERGDRLERGQESDNHTTWKYERIMLMNRPQGLDRLRFLDYR